MGAILPCLCPCRLSVVLPSPWHCFSDSFKYYERGGVINQRDVATFVILPVATLPPSISAALGTACAMQSNTPLMAAGHSGHEIPYNSNNNKSVHSTEYDNSSCDKCHGKNAKKQSKGKIEIKACCRRHWLKTCEYNLAKFMCGQITSLVRCNS